MATTKKNNDKKKKASSDFSIIERDFENINMDEHEEYLEAVGDVIETAVTGIRTQFKGTSDFSIGTLEELYSDLMPKKFISSGDDRLDLIISNRKNGGMPLSKFINIFGDSSTGKSLIAACIVAEFQKRHGYALWFDTERATFPPFMEVLGVKKERTIFVPKTRSIEKIFKIILDTVVNNQKRNSKAPLCIVIDSMTATNIETVIEDLTTMTAGGYDSGASKQKTLVGVFPKIMDYIKDENVLFVTIDQLRDNMNRSNAFSPMKRDTAGNAQRFYADIRLELKTVKKIKNKLKEDIGQVVSITTRKNRIAPSPRSCEIYLYNTRGLDRFASWIDELKSQKKLTTYGGKISYIPPNSEEEVLVDGRKPTEPEFKKMLRTNEKFREIVYNDFSPKYLFGYERKGDDYFDDIESEVVFEDEKDTDE